MQQMGSVQHTPQSGLRRRQHPQQVVDAGRVYEQMHMEPQQQRNRSSEMQIPRGLPNTALVPVATTDYMPMSSHQSSMLSS